MSTSLRLASQKFCAFAIGLLALTLSPASVSAQAADPNAPLATGQSTSRPNQIVVPRSPTIVLLPPVELAEVSAQVQARLRILPGVRSIAPLPDTPNVLRLVSHNDMSIRLDNLLSRLNQQGADRASEYDRFTANVATFLARTDPFKSDQLRIVIRSTSAIDAFEAETAIDGVPNGVVRRPFMEGLEEVVVGDTPTSIAFMPVARLTDLNLTPDAAFDMGRANTITEVSAISWRPVAGLLEVSAPTGYDTSLMALDPAWTASVERRLGGPIAVIIPTRDKIVIGRSDRPRDITRLRAILAAQAKGNLALSDKIWVRRNLTWVTR
jgi:hypothetical protein